MAYRIYGNSQYVNHRANNVVCEICAGIDPLARVQHADSRITHERGKNRIKIDCASYFDIDKAISWGVKREDIEREISYLHAQGITVEWHNKRVCSKCYDKFAMAIDNRFQ